MPLVVLGIESTAHTFGVGIAREDGKILANINSTYIPIHGGILPREAARHHANVAHKIILKALEKADIRLEEIDGIAVALGPGLGPCLRVGAFIARILALSYDKPLIPVNHAVAHVEIARLTVCARDPLFVYVSGGNTQIVAYSQGRYRVFGETLDIPIGNFFDTLARELGLPQPGTPQIEKLAIKGKNIIDLPYIVKGQDVSYSGLLTAILRKFKEDVCLEDLCLSAMEYAYAMLAEVVERALAHTQKRELVLAGGVARSKRLQEIMQCVAEEHDAIFKVVPDEYAGDNGAMIAWTGVLCLKSGIVIQPEESVIRQRWRIDEVDVPWMQ